MGMGCGTEGGGVAIAAREQKEKTMATDREILSAMEKLDKILSAPTAKALTAPRAKALNVDAFCGVYRQIRPILIVVLPVIERIPIVGKVAAAIRLLMKIADSVCNI